MNALRTDAQLKADIADLTEQLCEETGARRRELARRIDCVEAELLSRKQARLHAAHTDHFSVLLREDLAFSDCDGDEWQDLGDDAVTLVDDNRSDAVDLVQCTRDNYDYCVDAGASWRWVPLAFGPIQEAP